MLHARSAVNGDARKISKQKLVSFSEAKFAAVEVWQEKTKNVFHQESLFQPSNGMSDVDILSNPVNVVYNAIVVVDAGAYQEERRHRVHQRCPQQAPGQLLGAGGHEGAN